MPRIKTERFHLDMSEDSLHSPDVVRISVTGPEASLLPVSTIKQAAISLLAKVSPHNVPQAKDILHYLVQKGCIYYLRFPTIDKTHVANLYGKSITVGQYSYKFYSPEDDQVRILFFLLFYTFYALVNLLVY